MNHAITITILAGDGSEKSPFGLSMRDFVELKRFVGFYEGRGDVIKAEQILRGLGFFPGCHVVVIDSLGAA